MTRLSAKAPNSYATYEKSIFEKNVMDFNQTAQIMLGFLLKCPAHKKSDRFKPIFPELSWLSSKLQRSSGRLSSSWTYFLWDWDFIRKAKLVLGRLIETHHIFFQNYCH